MTDAIDLLVVDDDADAREMLGEFCTSLGFRVALAHDGRAALIALRRATPSFPVVIADLHMPHADGFDVLGAAWEAAVTRLHVGVALASGDADARGRARELLEGVVPEFDRLRSLRELVEAGALLDDLR